MQTNLRVYVSFVSVNEFNVYSQRVWKNKSYFVVEEGQLHMGEMGKVKVKCTCPMALMGVTSLLERSDVEGGWEVRWFPLQFNRSAHTLLLRTVLHNAVSTFASLRVHLSLATVHPVRSGPWPSPSRSPLPSPQSAPSCTEFLPFLQSQHSQALRRSWVSVSCRLLLRVSPHVLKPTTWLRRTRKLKTGEPRLGLLCSLGAWFSVLSLQSR